MSQKCMLLACSQCTLVASSFFFWFGEAGCYHVFWAICSLRNVSTGMTLVCFQLHAFAISQERVYLAHERGAQDGFTEYFMCIFPVP